MPPNVPVLATMASNPAILFATVPSEYSALLNCSCMLCTRFETFFFARLMIWFRPMFFAASKSVTIAVPASILYWNCAALMMS